MYPTRGDVFIGKAGGGHAREGGGLTQAAILQSTTKMSKTWANSEDLGYNIALFPNLGLDTAKSWCQNSRFRAGGIPKRSTGSDCKSDGSAFEGSNPSPSTKIEVAVAVVIGSAARYRFAGVAQW